MHIPAIFSLSHRTFCRCSQHYSRKTAHLLGTLSLWEKLHISVLTDITNKIFRWLKVKPIMWLNLTHPSLLLACLHYLETSHAPQLRLVLFFFLSSLLNTYSEDFPSTLFFIKNLFSVYHSLPRLPSIRRLVSWEDHKHHGINPLRGSHL